MGPINCVPNPYSRLIRIFTVCYVNSFFTKTVEIQNEMGPYEPSHQDFHCLLR